MCGDDAVSSDKWNPDKEVDNGGSLVLSVFESGTDVDTGVIDCVMFLVLSSEWETVLHLPEGSAMVRGSASQRSSGIPEELGFVIKAYVQKNTTHAKETSDAGLGDGARHGPSQSWLRARTASKR